MNHPLFAVAGQNYYLKPRNFLAQPQFLHYSLLLSRTPTGLAKSELSKKPSAMRRRTYKLAALRLSLHEYFLVLPQWNVCGIFHLAAGIEYKALRCSFRFKSIVPSGSSFHVVPCGKNAPISSLSAR